MATSRAILDFARVWKDLGEEVSVIRPEINGGVNQIHYLEGIETQTLRILKVPKTEFFFLGRLLKRVRAISPDLIVSHLINGMLVGRALAKKLHIKHFHGFHISDLKNLLSIPRYRKYYLELDGKGFRSYGLKELARKSDLPVEQASVLPSGIEADLIRPRDKEFEVPYRLVLCARLEAYKNIDLVLQALANWKTPFIFNIYGTGSQGFSLKKITKSLGLQRKVVFHGQVEREKCLDAMRQSDFYIMVSEETLGLAFLEAMACGNIVIGLKGWGIDGIVEHGGNGFLSKSKSPDDIADLLEKIPEFDLKTISSQCHRTIQQYTLEATGKAYLDQLKSLLAR